MRIRKGTLGNSFPRLQIKDNLRTCLLDDGPLIRHLEKFSSAGISLTLKAQLYGRPYNYEARALGVRAGAHVLLRQTLLCDTCPWVYARTVIPVTTLQSARRLARWGNMPLGDYLFAEKSVSRVSMQVKAVRAAACPDKILHELIGGHDRLLWERKSIFHLRRRPLLLTEIFLPPAIDQINAYQA